MDATIKAAKKAYDDACKALRSWRSQNAGPNVTPPVAMVDAIVETFIAYKSAMADAEMAQEVQRAHR